MSPRRLRIGFALLALALLAPSALLVQRALRGVTAEQEARHRAVAERVFDEMERALSALVAREEAREVSAWVDAEPPAGEPFLRGWFEVEPDGRVRAPRISADADADALAAVTGWLAAREDRAAAPAPPAQAPGTTLAFREPSGGSEVRPSVTTPPEGAYEALQKLNRGASERATRERKLELRPAAELEAFAQRAQAPARPERSAAAGAPPAAAGGALDAAPPPAPALDAAAAARAGKDRVRVAVDPLVGRLAGGRHLLLTRSVFAGGAALRQGLVLDVERLGPWLRERAFGGERLPGATLAFASEGASAATPPSGAYRYRHRFAEPFDGLSAALALEPLGGGAGAGAIYALSALLALTGTAGLFALYRMAAVAMAFAERRSNFVAAVTHELKTPVTAIRLYGEMLRDDLVPSDEKRREYYGTITAESERLGRLVDDVLELARLERGTRDMQLAAAAPGPAVEEIAARLRPQAERAGFALRCAVAPDLPLVRFERDALLQVLSNLVDNALKYARDATAREIAIECRREGDGVVVVVRDRGPGVASRHLPRIFEPFHRGEDESVRRAQGTGLGLALVKGLVERMGGAVAGSNVAGGGFEVRVELPSA